MEEQATEPKPHVVIRNGERVKAFAKKEEAEKLAESLNHGIQEATAPKAEVKQNLME